MFAPFDPELVSRLLDRCLSSYRIYPGGSTLVRLLSPHQQRLLILSPWETNSKFKIEDIDPPSDHHPARGCSKPVNLSVVYVATMLARAASTGTRRILFTRKTFLVSPPRYASSYSPIEWWKNRQESQQASKYRDRLLAMASSERWTLTDMQQELREVSNSWSAKLPGLSQQKEIKTAQQLETIVQALLNVCTTSGTATDAGTSATTGTTTDSDAIDADRLERMDRKEKLQAAVQAGVPVEEINRTIQQFQMMAMMQKALRQCKEKGTPIPTTQEGVQTLIQSQGIQLLTKKQRAKFGKEQAKRMMRTRRS